jgi:undecaprenyl-diphosphatase
MLSDLLGLNWQFFESLNHTAGSDAPLDSFMVFSAQDLIYLLPLLLLALWIGVMRWPLRGRRASAISPRGAAGARGVSAEERARTLGQQMVLLTAVAVVGALALNLALAHLINEPRPFVSHPGEVHQLIPHAADNAFPSDHETVASALAAMLLFYALRLVAPRWAASGIRLTPPSWLLALAVPLAVLGVAMALTIGIGRVYAGVHYPLDILGGMLCGIFGGVIALALRNVVQPLLNGIVGLAERLRLA